VTLTVEPVMHVVIVVPQTYAAGVEARLPRYRGRVISSEHRDGVQTIRARVPQVDVAAFVSELILYTEGRARTSMVVYEYWPTLQDPPGEPTAGVREPRPRRPVLRSGAIAVPEPDADSD
jgi:translation elongation factor EF-G